MKRLLLISCMAFMSSLAGICPPARVIFIPLYDPVMPYEELWNAVCQVESGNDPLRYNKKENAVGVAQIRQPMLTDFNRKTGNHLTLKQMYNRHRSKSVFYWHCSRYRPDQIEQIARSWNGGKSGIKKHSTKEYYKKVLKFL